MNFKLKALAATCALAFAGQAAALPTTAAVQVQMFVSGSSALQFMIGQVADSLLDPTTTDVYYDGTAAGVASGSSYRAYFGKASPATVVAYPSLYDAASTTPAGCTNVAGAGNTCDGLNVLILETAKGGSINGVTPITRGVAVNSLDLFNTTTPCVVSSPAKIFGTHTVYSCPAVNATRIPDFGISDVEPSILQVTANMPSGTLLDGSSWTMTAAEAANLNSIASIGQTFGIALSNVASGAIAAPTTLTSLTKAQIAGLLSGQTTDWHIIDPTVASKSKTIVYCRRQAGSGTHATLLARVLGNPCSSNPLPAAAYTNTVAVSGTGKTAKTVVGTSTPVPAGSYVVVENSSAGVLAACIDAAVNGTGTDATTGNPNYINLTTGAIAPAATAPANSVILPSGNIALGELGLDYSKTTSDVFNFASVDGIAPTTTNAAAGLYDITTESTFNENAANMATTLAAGTAAGDIIKAFEAAAGNPTILGAAAIPGVLGLTENKWVASNPDVATNPVMRMGNAGNSCQPMIQKQ